MIWYLRTTPASSTPSCHVLSSQPFYLHSLSTCISPTSVCLGKRCSCYSGWTALFFPNPISLDQEPTLFSWHVSPSQLVEHHFIDFCSPYYSPYQRDVSPVSFLALRSHQSVWPLWRCSSLKTVLKSLPPSIVPSIYYIFGNKK